MSIETKTCKYLNELVRLTMSKSLFKILGFLTILSTIALLNHANYMAESAAQMGHGHNLPSASLGDREALLIFSTEPPELKAGKNVGFNFNLKDNKTGNSILHVTYLVTVMKEGQRLFTETVHTHDGSMKLLFVPDGTNPYRMNANFDGLSASYISEFGSPIKINGPIFTTPGNYSVSFEVTGVDFDNLFLPEPPKFDFGLLLRN
ncbi:MAG TPA: hypothetical protein VH415_10950 [Nitrososphaeraceae archaeon]